jgi:hypothetical protein
LLSAGDRLKGYYTEFNVDGLLQGDSAARAAFYQIMALNGFFTRNEVRVRENLAKAKGGDTLTVAANLVPLDQLGLAPSDAQAVRSALRSFLGVDDQSAPVPPPANP